MQIHLLRLLGEEKRISVRKPPVCFSFASRELLDARYDASHKSVDVDVKWQDRREGKDMQRTSKTPGTASNGNIMLFSFHSLKDKYDLDNDVDDDDDEKDRFVLATVFTSVRMVYGS
ncbi:hypothetical protein ZHAS_00017308 [Anopheles sinensis]|uniref:Uncharacterized protein n=1 Tax=Anopheles sinensis TaxID=74873 RepID=A0A084WG08_ANOSI|nr:hypothetical protein ZHAS_00017308 [Anopheles sinensis]